MANHPHRISWITPPEYIPIDHAETKLLQDNTQVPDAVNGLNAERSNSCDNNGYRVAWLACSILFILACIYRLGIIAQQIGIL